MAARNKNLPGQDGMAILKYVGGNAGDETWVGPATKTTYFLGGVRRKGYVDKRDKAGMLAIRDGKRPVFVEVKAAVEAPSIVMTEPASPSLDPVASPPRTLTGLSVAKIKGTLPSLTAEGLEAFLSAEKSGKNRSTAIAAIEAALNERLA